MDGGKEKSAASVFFTTRITCFKIADLISANAALITIPVFPIKQTQREIIKIRTQTTPETDFQCFLKIWLQRIKFFPDDFFIFLGISEHFHPHDIDVSDLRKFPADKLHDRIQLLII